MARLIKDEELLDTAHPRDAAIVCMHHLFEFQESLASGEVTIDELTEVMRLSISDGHDAMAIALSMAAMAAVSSRSPQPDDKEIAASQSREVSSGNKP